MLRARLLIPILILTVGAAVAYWLMQPPTFGSAMLERGQVVDVVYATGLVRPSTETRVAPEVAGRITALAVDEGDSVTPGQIIAQLDDSQSRLRLREAEDRLATARARLLQVTAPSDPYLVRQLEAQVRGAEARMRGAQDRSRSLEDRIATSKSAAASAASAVAGGQARLRAQRGALRAAGSEIEAATQRVETARAEVLAAQAGAEAAGDLLRRRRQLLREGAIAERQVTEAETALQGAEATARAQKSRVDAAEQAVGTARANLESIQAQVDDAQATVDTAGINAMTAQAQVVEAQGALQEQRRQVDAAIQDLAGIRAQLAQANRGERLVNIEPIRAEVRTAESAVLQARDQVGRHTVRSPIRGQVTDRPVDPGDYVPAGGRIFNIAGEEKVYVQADVDEADIGLVRLGSPARFQVDSQPGMVFEGRVTLIGNAADRATRTYAVEIRDLRDKKGLRIGMTTDVNIQGRTITGALLIRTAALESEKDETLAWVVDALNHVHRRRVKIRARDANVAQVLEGLQAGDKVVLQPAGKLRDGQRIRLR